MYKLNLNLPLEFDVPTSRAFFNCQTRSLILVLPVSGMILSNQDTPIEEDTPQEPKEEEEKPKEESEAVTLTAVDFATEDMLGDVLF